MNCTGGGSTASYAYSPDGMRTSKTVDGVTTRQIWLGGNITAELTRSETLTCTHGYYLYNAHGDVVGLSDGSGQVT